MLLKNLNLYSDNITIFVQAYDNVFIVKSNRTEFTRLKGSDLEVDEITVLGDNEIYIYSSIKDYNVCFVMKAFAIGLTVMDAKLNKISMEDFIKGCR